MRKYRHRPPRVKKLLSELHDIREGLKDEKRPQQRDFLMRNGKEKTNELYRLTAAGI